VLHLLTHLPAHTLITLKARTLRKAEFNRVRSSCTPDSHLHVLVSTLSKSSVKLSPNRLQLLDP